MASGQAEILREDGYSWNRRPYEWKSASVNVAGVTGDTNLKTISGFTTLFDTVKIAHNITIESTGTAYIRLNAATNDIITITATTPYSTDYGVVDKIFVTSGGSAVTVTVKLR